MQAVMERRAGNRPHVESEVVVDVALSATTNVAPGGAVTAGVVQVVKSKTVMAWTVPNLNRSTLIPVAVDEAKVAVP